MKPYWIFDSTTGCWNWNRSLHANGYGQRSFHRKNVLAHRWVYEKFRGPIPEGLTLDHLCRNRACVNPEHLEPVTHAVNNRRGSKGRLTAEQVLAIRASSERNTPLSRKLGVSHSLISMIKAGKRAQDIGGNRCPTLPRGRHQRLGLTNERIAKIRDLRNQGSTYSEIASSSGVSKTHVFRLVRAG